MHAYFDENELRRRLKAALQDSRHNMKAICDTIGCGEASMFDFLEGKSVFGNETLRSLQSTLSEIERIGTVVDFPQNQPQVGVRSSSASGVPTTSKIDRGGFLELSSALLVAIAEFSGKIQHSKHNDPPETTSEIAKLEATIADLEAEITHLRSTIDELEERTATKSVKNIKQHLEVFLDNFMPIAGRGTAILFVATATASLAKLGYDSDLLSKAIGQLQSD